MYYTIKPKINDYRALAILNRNIGIAIARRTNVTVNDLASNLEVEWIEETQGRDDCDFPRFTSLLLCLSNDAKNCFMHNLQKNGELFSLKGIEQDYFAFNCLNILDVMDVDLASKMESRGEILSIYDNEAPLAIKSNELNSFSNEQLFIFKVPQIRNKFVVSQEFKNIYDTKGLVGLDFIPCITC